MIAISARLDIPIPGSPVPQSAQTFAVLLVGVWLGARLGAVALFAYLLAGGLGAPVFADGASGWGHLVGPTAGYLVGFLLAATLMGSLSDRGHLSRLPLAIAGMLAGHVVILGLGWARLGAALGPAEAWAQGVAPFLVGGLVKSLVAALLAVLFVRMLDRTRERAERRH